MTLNLEIQPIGLPKSKSSIMASVVIGALLVALAATNALAQSCAEGGGTSKISFSNGDFEARLCRPLTFFFFLMA